MTVQGQSAKPGRPPKRGIQSVEEPGSEDESTSNRGSSRARVPPTPDSPATKPAKAEKGPKPKGRPPKSGGAGQAKSVTSRRLNNIVEKADYIDEAAFKNFKYGVDDLDEFTPERCSELEAHYWRSLGFQPADVCRRHAWLAV